MGDIFDNVTMDTRPGPSLEYTVVAVGLPLVIFIIGLAGNVLVITVIVRRRSLQTPTNCYLLSLCVADCILLLSSNLPTIPEPLLPAEDWPYGSFMCTLLVFLGYLGANVSSLSIGAFTVERYIGICHSLKAQTICTVSRARRILFVLWTVAVLYCSPWLALAKVVPSYRNGTVVHSCTYTLKRRYYGIYYAFDFVMFYVVPLVLSSVLYVLMIRLLLKDIAPRSTEHRCLQGRPSRSRGVAARMQVRFDENFYCHSRFSLCLEQNVKKISVISQSPEYMLYMGELNIINKFSRTTMIAIQWLIPRLCSSNRDAFHSNWFSTRI